MKKFGLIMVTAALFSAGCQVATEGNQGNILFEPRDCGLLVCAFAKGLAVGGLAEVQISGINNYPTAGIDLLSSDATVLDVFPVADVNGRATWGLEGVQAGIARLDAVDSTNATADFISVQVSVPSALVGQHFSGQAVGPTSDSVYDEIWQVNILQDVRFDVVPQLDGTSLMGNMLYAASVDNTLNAALLPAANLATGRVYFNVSVPGDYALTLTDVSGVSVNILYQAQ